MTREERIAFKEIREILLFQIGNLGNEAKYLISPHIPGIISQPDILFIPSLGKLLSINIVFVPKNQSLWELVFHMIESLFEIKLFTGSYTFSSIILVELNTKRPIENNLHSDAYRFLHRFFDHTYYLRISESISNEFPDEFISNIIQQEIKQDLFELWDREKGRRESNIQKNLDNPVLQQLSSPLNNADTQPGFIQEKRQIRLVREEIFENMKDVIEDQFKITRNPRVQNNKNLFFDSVHTYYFYFDFLIHANEVDYSNYFHRSDYDDISIVEALKGGYKEYKNLKLLQKLMMYSVFINNDLQIDWGFHDDFRVTPNLNLVIDGLLLGPSHDPQRYLRLLLSGGWNIVPLNNMSIDALDLSNLQ